MNINTMSDINVLRPLLRLLHESYKDIPKEKKNSCLILLNRIHNNLTFIIDSNINYNPTKLIIHDIMRMYILFGKKSGRPNTIDNWKSWNTFAYHFINYKNKCVKLI